METEVPRPRIGRADVPQRGRRIHGHIQLQEPGFDPPGGVAGESEAELPGDPAHHRHEGTKPRFGEGHPVAPVALASRHHHERVHAGTAGERAADGRNGL